MTSSSQKSIVKCLKAVNRQLSRIKQCCNDQPIFKNIERCALLSILIAFIFFVYGYCIKDKYNIKDFQYINQAWQTGSDNGIYSLEYITKNVSTSNNIDLSNAILPRADISGANLEKTNLEGAHLRRANFSDANLSGANLTKANLEETILSGALFEKATLQNANLSWALLFETDLSGANLSGANLNHAHLDGVDLRGANLKGITNWKNNVEPNNSFNRCNIYGVKHAPEGFVEWCKHRGSVEIKTNEEWNKFKNRLNPAPDFLKKPDPKLFIDGDFEFENSSTH